MNWPNRLTVLRILLSPLFFVLYSLPRWRAGASEADAVAGDALGVLSAVGVLLVFAVIEFSDVLDGHLARRWNLVTDIGKVIDPFADVMARMTYFFCFTLSGLMPGWIFLVLIYRELGITFLRMLLIRRGIAMAASKWGKAKALTHALGGVLGVIYFALAQFAPDAGAALRLLASTALAVFVLGAVSSVISFVIYIVKAAPELSSRR
jgi:CDP-diacylglycerol--glycerol-3-phosphate 3-phosphatidyltransferase